MEEVAQTGCGVTLLGDLQKLSGLGSGQPTLNGPALAVGLD